MSGNQTKNSPSWFDNQQNDFIRIARRIDLVDAAAKEPSKIAKSRTGRPKRFRRKSSRKVAASEIAMIKVTAPHMAQRVFDRAIQAHGGAGVSDDFGLAHQWSMSRSMRILDGPDEVHLETIARMELKRSTDLWDT